jgi:hypothetical protein
MLFRTTSAHEFTSRLRLLETTGDGWEKTFLDESTGERWREYHPYPDDRCPTQLRRDPLPDDLRTLIEACLISPSPEDWCGLGAHLSGRFSAEGIAPVLRELAPRLPREALDRFGRSYRAEDQRDIVGMEWTAVQESYRRFRAAVDEIASLTNQTGR